MTVFTPARLAVGAFTLLYIIVGAVYLLREHNREFILYLLILVALLAAGFYIAARFELPAWMLWLLSVLGALHLAGGGLKVHGDVLYNLVLIPIKNPTGLTFWKYDQLVHPYGGLIAAFIAYALFARSSRGSRFSLAAAAFLIANGAGALNEVVEFITKIAIPYTDVGGYYNTALDLTFNMVGAFFGSLAAAGLIRRNLDDRAVSS